MIFNFRDLSVQKKMATIFLAICSALVLFMTILFVYDKIYSFRQGMVETHSMLARTIAINSTAALIFDDEATAEEVLSALRVVKDVENATIYRMDGEVFATYSTREKSASPQTEPNKLDEERLIWGKNAKHSFKKNYLELTTPIILDDKQLGTLTLRANLKHLYNRIIVSIFIIVTLIFMLGIVAQLVSNRLYRAIAKPLVGLLSTMSAVTEEKNYTYRIQRMNNDELGDLTDGFNSMLAEIEKREEELAKHREELEDLVDKRTSELLLSNQRLKLEIEERQLVQDQLARAQRMEAIGTLAAGVAHDLNNILSGVVSYPEFLLMALEKDDDMYAPLVTIKTSGQKAAAIVQDLLTLSRRGGAALEVVDLKEVIDDYLVSAECRKMLGFHPDVTILKEITSGTSSIIGSPIHLSKTVMNLLTNAAEAITDAGTITVRLRNCYLDRPVKGYEKIVEGSYVHLQVQDTGHGISNEDQRYIFEPFYTKKKMGKSGTGLGMAVVWGTVEDHKGYIDIDSNLGAGTTFDLYFPATDKIGDKKPVEEPPTSVGSGESILIVDDVKDQRLIASDILRQLGYVVNTVASGEEAIAYLENNPTDLLILDMIMDPGIDGIETYRQALQLYPRQRALIASGYSEATKVAMARELGVQIYLSKPYTVSNLAEAVREELDRGKTGESIDDA